jgi:hypothetical protein
MRSLKIMIRSALNKKYPSFTHLFYCFIMDWYRYQLLIHNVLPPTLPKQCGPELQFASSITDARKHFHMFTNFTLTLIRSLGEYTPGKLLQSRLSMID